MKLTTLTASLLLLAASPAAYAFNAGSCFSKTGCQNYPRQFPITIPQDSGKFTLFRSVSCECERV